MSSQTDTTAGSAGHPHSSSPFWLLTLGCAGVVYGDIGTSPLYAFREAAAMATGEAGIQPDVVFGVLSLILWTLVVIVTLKYVVFLLRADNNGEGGILSLMSLAHNGFSDAKKAAPVFMLGLAGAALFYGDAAITPAISVLSAIEGLEIAAPDLSHLVLPLSIIILIGLFSMQKHGTQKVSVFFGPVTVGWFLLMGFLGLWHVVLNPHVLLAINPYYAGAFLYHHASVALLTLGAVFLAVTGAEALYADLGHFGRKPIQTAWLGLAFPCLTLNYLGQGALVLSRPEAISNPFFLLVPHWALIPLICYATIATIIASQAVITGAYSLTRQAIQLGLLPRMDIQHTSANQEGQIYIPKVNRWLLWAVLLLCVMFGSSTRLASAYGIAVTGTMLITASLVFVVLWKVWKRPIWQALLVVTPFFAVELVFLGANLLKLFDGGILPLFIASLLGLFMITWVRGTRYLHVWALRRAVSMQKLMKQLEETPPIWVDGTAIFMTSDPQHAPMALIQNLKHNKVMHRNTLILTVKTLRQPMVEYAHSVSTERLTENILYVSMHFGYMQTPDVPRMLAYANERHDLGIDLDEATYFLSTRSLKPDADKGLRLWQANIYSAINSTAASATDFFHIPLNQVVELGQKLEI